MRYILLLFALAYTINFVYAQDSTVIQKQKDSLFSALRNSKEDTNRVNIFYLLAIDNVRMRGDSFLMYIDRALELAEKLNILKKESFLRNLLGNYYWNVANYTGALNQYMQVVKISEQIKYDVYVSVAYANIGNTYFSMGNLRKAYEYSKQSMELSNRMGDSSRNSFCLTTIGEVYSKRNMPDSALYFAIKGLQESKKIKNDFRIARSMQALGDIYSSKQDIQQALYWYRAGITHAEKGLFGLGTSGMMAAMSELYYKNGQKDSAIIYAKKALDIAQSFNALTVVVQAATLLHDFYKPSDEHQSLQYLEIAAAAKDSVFNIQKNNELQNIAYNEEATQKDKEAAEIQFKNNIRFYMSIALLAVIVLVVLIQVKNNNRKKKANLLLQKQKQKVEDTLSELKATQAQLIQTEKMASLGELTAGIAHEIQNPLNFVNNFSDLNNELIDEVSQANAAGNPTEVNELLITLKENEQKINHHGKRAEAIVKGMLQHSRSSSGIKESADINALTDEYLRLAYHGLRAKDKNFNANMKTDFDKSVGNVDIIPQDIGRVLLNLYNNAFYVVNEKKKQHPTGYDPTVSVSTKRITDKVEIRVKDNGNGIPQKVVGKIFQPFFTTKPTGQGTGLGLSLSYDIIKAHGGAVKVTSKDGEGSEFIVELPAPII